MLNLPNGININHLIDDLRIFSWEAADTLLFYSKKLKLSENYNNIILNDCNEDPSTSADLKVNEIIIKRINEKYKDIDWGILSEENVKKGEQNCDINRDWLWVIDPLDGTKDFIQGTSNYAMHLALNYKKTALIGVVLIPEKNELWITNGKKTWCERRDGTQIKYPINNNINKKSLKEMILVTSKNHNNEILRKLIKKVDFKKVIVMGSIGCKVASIIRGESDIYISLSLPGQSSPKDWDFAAPEAILKAFGGAITNLENKELNYGSSKFEQRGIIIASNNKNNHESTCMQLKAIINKFDIYPFKD